LVKSDKDQVIHVAGLDGPGLVTPEDSKRMRSRVVVLEPGKEVGEHTTEDREELLTVLEGKVVLVGPDGEHPIVPGQAAFIPLGTKHNVINRTKAPARYMYVLALCDEYSKITGHSHGYVEHHHH
jgi:quercetin dioxygenase-like cupin family protein